MPKEPTDRQIQDVAKRRDEAERGERYLEAAVLNLRYALWIFRKRANLHWNSEDQDLIAALYREEPIATRPGADEVLEALSRLHDELDAWRFEELGLDEETDMRADDEQTAEAVQRLSALEDRSFARWVWMHTGRSAETIRPKVLN